MSREQYRAGSTPGPSICENKSHATTLNNSTIRRAGYCYDRTRYLGYPVAMVIILVSALRGEAYNGGIYTTPALLRPF